MIKKIIQKYRTPSALDASDWIVLVIGLAIFIPISLWTISKSSIWFDEAFGAFMIHFSFIDIAKYTGADVHPPVYYWLLKLWSMLFGNTEFALRSMSTLFAGVAIAFGYLLAHRLFGRKAAWTSLPILVLAPMLVRYSQEMRMYALAAAICLAATYVLTFAMESKGKRAWILYGVLVSLGMWTHYFTAIIWIAHWLWRVYVVRAKTGNNKKKFVKAYFNKQWILAHVVALGLYIPWMPFLVYQVFDVQANGFWIPPVTPTTPINFLTNVLYYQDQELVTSWAALIFAVIFILLAVLAFKLWRGQTEKQRESYLLVFMIGFVPMILLFLLSMPPLRSSFVDRYLVPSTVGISLFIGSTLALSAKTLQPKLRALAFVVVTGAMVVGIGNVYRLGNYNKTLHSANDTRQIVEALTAKAGDGQPIIADSPWLFYEAVFYSTANHPVYFIDAKTDYKFGSLNMLKDDTQHKIKDLEAFEKQHSTVWYLGRPGDNSVTPPEDSWKEVQQVRVSDSVSGNPSYQAVEYKTN